MIRRRDQHGPAPSPSRAPSTGTARAPAPGVPAARAGRASPRAVALASGLLVVAGVLAACGDGGSAPTSTASLSPTEQAAVDQAAAAVLAYRQVVTDLYTGQRTKLADLNAVAVTPELAVAQRSVSQAKALGYHSRPRGARVTLVSAEPVSVDLGASPPTVVLNACVDATAVTAVSPGGVLKAGRRQRQEYRVVHLESMPGSGWAVGYVDDDGRPQDSAC